MKVNLHATYRIATGQKSVQMDWIEGMDIDMLIRGLVERYPQLRSALFAEGETVSASVHIFVNRRDVTHLPEGRQRQMDEDDVIDLFPPISGGKLG